MSRVKVFVVDDHALFRRGLVELLRDVPDFEVVGEAGLGRDAVGLVSKLSPDVVLMDVNMPGVDGIAATAALCQLDPATKVLMLTVSENPDTLWRAMAAGARGYVQKTANPDEIMDAVRQISQGWVVVSSGMAPRLLNALRAPGPRDTRSNPSRQPEVPLTRREEEVLQLIARGATNQQIAEELVISVDTVKSHVRSILGKLHASSKREAMVWAREKGVVLQAALGGP